MAKPAAAAEIDRAPDANRLRELLARLIAFRTENPPGDEAAPARFLAGILQQLGCDVATPAVARGRRNLVAVFENGDGPGLGVIAAACDVVIDRRILPGEAVDAEIRALLGTAARGRGVRTEILSYSSNAGPSETPGDDPIVQASLAACRAQGIALPGPVGFLGGCDLVHFQKVGIPGVVLGPGSLEQAHQPDEYVALADLVRASLIYRDLALDWFRRQSI
jgi:acetylornithine deacetylase/succinyl-diaminopimelate desuccinylase-like protein